MQKGHMIGEIGVVKPVPGKVVRYKDTYHSIKLTSGNTFFLDLDFCEIKPFEEEVAIAQPAPILDAATIEQQEQEVKDAADAFVNDVIERCASIVIEKHIDDIIDLAANQTRDEFKSQIVIDTEKKIIELVSEPIKNDVVKNLSYSLKDQIISQATDQALDKADERLEKLVETVTSESIRDDVVKKIVDNVSERIGFEAKDALIKKGIGFFKHSFNEETLREIILTELTKNFSQLKFEQAVLEKLWPELEPKILAQLKELAAPKLGVALVDAQENLQKLVAGHKDQIVEAVEKDLYQEILKVAGYERFMNKLFDRALLDLSNELRDQVHEGFNKKRVIIQVVFSIFTAGVFLGIVAIAQHIIFKLGW